MTVYSGLPLFYRYIQQLNQQISDVPAGTSEPLFFPAETAVSFVSTYTAEEWRKIFDCILFGADFLYPDESHDIMFSWLKQVEWPVLPVDCEENVLVFVPPTTGSDVAFIDIASIPQNYTNLRLDFAFESDTMASFDHLELILYPLHEFTYYSSGAVRDNADSSWVGYQSDGVTTGLRVERVVSSQQPTNVVAAAGYIEFPFYARDNADFFQQCYGMGNFAVGRNNLGTWQFSGLLDGNNPIEGISLRPVVGDVFTDYTYSVMLFGKLD